MFRARILSSAFLGLLLLLPCAAQNLIPVIQLSADEAAKAKQLVQVLKDARERTAKAHVAWEQFHKVYQAVHPDLPDLRFSEDFRLAVARVNDSVAGIFQITAIELTAEERQKLDTLHREIIQSEDSQKHAENNWKDFKIQLVVKHIGSSTTGNGSVVLLSTGVGGNIVLPNPWTGDLAFTTDFRFATPPNR